jgi:hypothetical protein
MFEMIFLRRFVDGHRLVDLIKSLPGTLPFEVLSTVIVSEDSWRDVPSSKFLVEEAANEAWSSLALGLNVEKDGASDPFLELVGIAAVLSCSGGG